MEVSTAPTIAWSTILCDEKYNPGNQNSARKTTKVLILLTFSQAALLMARTHVIKVYSLFEFLKLVPNRNAVGEAHKNLIGLSNSIHGGINATETHKMRKEIEKLLDIEPRDP